MSAVFQRVGSTASTALPSGSGGMATDMHPQDMRVLARSQAYVDSEIEREAIARVERAVFDRVRTYERALVDVANGFREDAKVDLQAATDTAAALRSRCDYRCRTGPTHASWPTATRTSDATPTSPAPRSTA